MINKVSVIMPVFNGEKTIKQAVASVMIQSYTNWELIIVNDGSTDRTKLILDNISDPRVKVIHLSNNQGRGIARDIGLQHAEGTYLAFLDADDMMHEDKLKVQVFFLDKEPHIYMVGVGCITIDKTLSPVGMSACEKLQGNFRKYGEALPLLLPTAMVRLHHAKKFSYKHYLDVGEDYDFFARYLVGHDYENIPLPYYYYTIGNQSRRKILYYQIRSLQIRIEMIKEGQILMGLKSMITRVAKLFCYILVLPFKRDYIVNKRHTAISLSDQVSEEYWSQIGKVKHYLFNVSSKN